MSPQHARPESIPFEERAVRGVTPRLMGALFAGAISLTAVVVLDWANLRSAQTASDAKISALQEAAATRDRNAATDHDLLIRMNGKLDALLAGKYPSEGK